MSLSLNFKCHSKVDNLTSYECTHTHTNTYTQYQLLVCTINGKVHWYYIVDILVKKQTTQLNIRMIKNVFQSSVYSRKKERFIIQMAILFYWNIQWSRVIKTNFFCICFEKLIMSIEKPKPKEYFQFQASIDENRRARITLVLFVFNLFVAVL